MKRTNLNFLIDCFAFTAMMLLASTGLLMAHKLPHGSGGQHAMGSGQGAAGRPVALLWGMTRHEWGDLHYWIGYALLAVLAVHVVLHWKWIVCVAKGAPSTASPRRLLVGAIALAAVIGMSVAPFVSPTVSITRGEFAAANSPPASKAAVAPAAAAAAARSPEQAPASAPAAGGPSIRGSMSLAEVAAAADRPVAEILAKLRLPAQTDASERAGRLLRRHGLEMTDLRQALGLSGHDENSVED